MIKDKLTNAHIYYGISDKLQKGLEWLQKTDLSSLNDGRFAIDGDEIYANIQTYETKESAPYEAHRKYLDIQFVVNGCEKVGVTDISHCSVLTDYEKERDIEFLECKNNESYQILNSGDFLILFPHDAHKPSLSLTSKSCVKKVVVKVAL